MSRHARDDFSVYPKIYQNLPPHLEAELKDPALEFENVTFCYWRLAETGRFASGIEGGSQPKDGSSFLLSQIYTTADDYIADARDYFEGVDSQTETMIREYFSETS